MFELFINTYSQLLLDDFHMAITEETKQYLNFFLNLFIKACHAPNIWLNVKKKKTCSASFMEKNGLHYQTCQVLHIFK